MTGECDSLNELEEVVPILRLEPNGPARAARAAAPSGRPDGRRTIPTALFAGARSRAEAVDLLDRRIRGYLATVGQRGEGSRNSAAFQVAAWLLKDMALPTSVAEAYLRDWNDGNEPPLPEAELLQVLRSADRSGVRAIGAALDTSRARRHG